MAYKLLDLFSGCGGMTLGFVHERFCGKFDSVFALDNDPASVETYARNFGPHVHCLGIEDAIEEGYGFPQADVVIGGPPCQGFSILNRDRDGDARRALWKPFMEIVALSKAEVFVIENVQYLISSPELKSIEEWAEDAGFKTAAGILNAADYGTPQVRRRVFIVGWKTISGDAPVFPPPQTHFSPDSGIEPTWLTVRDAIGDLPEPEEFGIRRLPPPLDIHFRRQPTQKSLMRYKAVPPGGNRFDLQRKRPELTPACWIKKKSGGTDLFGRLWWEKPSVTIRTEFFKPEKGRYLHPEKHRPITHREAARFMGFPDDFVFIGKKIEIARQIGNAVPPPLAGAVARSVATYLDAVRKRNIVESATLCA